MAHRTLIKGGAVITVDAALGDFPTGDVLIEDTTIIDVGPELPAADAKVIDATDCLVLYRAPRGNQFATIEVTEQDWALAAELDIRISCHFGDGEWGRVGRSPSWSSGGCWARR
jgi:hypothetical protein